MLAYNHGENLDKQRRGRFEVPVDIARLSILVTMIIEIDKDGDDNDSENVINEWRRHEIPLVSINTPMLAKNVRFLESVMCFGLICYSRCVKPLNTFL